MENASYWTQPGGTKLWVDSDKTGTPAGALLAVDRPTATSPPTTVWRPPESVGASPGDPQFYPGLLQIPEAGQWRLNVTIGPDTGCFLTMVAPS